MVSDGMLYAGAGLTGTAVTVLCLTAAGAARRRGRGERLAAVIGQYGAEAVPRLPAVRRTAGMSAVAGRLLRSLRRERSVAAALEEAGIARLPGEWALLWAAVALGVAVVVTLASGSPLPGIPVGAAVAWLGSRTVLSARTSRRRAAFSDQLPEALQLVAGSLRSGFSLPQAVAWAAGECAQPVAAELTRAVRETEISGALDAALDAVAARAASRDLTWVVTGIRTCAQTGGNLAAVLDSTARTMRERASLRRHARSLSAEGRLSARILTGLPVVIALWLMLADRAYMRPLYTTGPGIAVSAIAVLLVIAGTLWMRAVTKAEQ